MSDNILQSFYNNKMCDSSAATHHNTSSISQKIIKKVLNWPYQAMQRY